MNELVNAWVLGYRKAWESNDPIDIRGLFTEDAIYRGTPSQEPGWVGHEQIVAGWLANQDPPGSTSFDWHIVAVDGSIAVIQALTTYPAGPKRGTYDNLWIVRLAPDGRASDYTDWFVAREPIS